MGVLWVHDIPASAATVRHNLDYDLRQHGVGAEIAADAAVLASELVANAIRHARPLPSGHLQVEWEVTDRDVTIAVTDGGSDEQPHLNTAGPQDTSGRGLTIVAALASDWGTRSVAGRNTVWARIERVRHEGERPGSELRSRPAP